MSDAGSDSFSQGETGIPKSETVFKPVVIYFDSNPLIAAGWPNASAQLLEALDMAKDLNVRAVLPAPVVEELSEHWLRDIRKSWQLAKDGIRSLNGKAASISLQFPKLDPLPANEAMKAYLQQAAAPLHARFVITPMTKKTTQHFFSEAIKRLTTFDEKGKGFQDSVILHSILDEMKSSKVSAGIIVSGDGDFDRSDCARLIKDAGVTLMVVKDLDGLRRVLEEHLETMVRLAHSEERNKVIAALERHKDDLLTYIAENLQLSQEFGVSGTVGKILSVEVLSIDDAHIASMASLEGDQPKDRNLSMIRVSAEINTRFDLAVEPYSLPHYLHPYTEISPEQAKLFGINLDKRTIRLTPKELPHLETLERLVIVEADATSTESGYTNIHFTSVRLKPALVGLGDYYTRLISPAT